MGTWGVHSFENDDAVEWAAAYREMGLSVAASTLRVAIEDHVNGTLTADIAARGVAAAEAVAYELGRGSAEAQRLFASAPASSRDAAEALVSTAEEFIMCATGGSELAALWKEADWDDHRAWLASLTDLRSRLQGEVQPAPVVAEAPASVISEDMIEDLRKAIGGLSYDIQVLRQEMEENFSRLAARIEGAKR